MVCICGIVSIAYGLHTHVRISSLYRHRATCISYRSSSMATTCRENSPAAINGHREDELAARLSNGPSAVREGCSETDDDYDQEDNNQDIEVQMVVPPDGGWGWVIVAASFMCNVVVDGIIFSFGIFLSHIADAFSVSKAQVALVGSLQTGFYLIAGPFVSALANKYGFRLVAMLGSVISSFAFILSFFSPSIQFLYFSYGVLGGIGAGLIYVPAVISAGFYFERWRALATGIAVCGSGIGAFVLGPITEVLINSYGWRGTLLIQAGMLFNCAVFGALLRPLKPVRVKVNPATDKMEIEMGPLFGKSDSLGCLYSTQPSRRRQLLGTNNNTEFSTAAQLIGSSPNIVNCRSLHSLHKDTQAAAKHGIKLNNRSVDRLSVPIYPESEIANDDRKTVEEENNLLSGDLERLNGRVPTTRRHTVCARRDGSNSNLSQKSYKSRQANVIAKDGIQRPFYRDDIFYGGSLSRLPHYRSQVSSVGYHMSVTRLPTEADVAEEASGACYVCPEGVRRILATMLDVSLLKSPSFLILATSGGLTMLGFYTPFTYLRDRAVSNNIEESTATLLLSVIGIGNTIGRIVCGLANSIAGVDALLVNNIFISISGIATILSGLSDTKEYQFFYAASFGLSISVFAALRSIIVVDLMGLEKLTNAFGLALLFQGVGAAAGTPLAGLFLDFTGSYDVSFYISGSLILASAVICYPLGRISRWEKLRESQKNSIESQ